MTGTGVAYPSSAAEDGQFTPVPAKTPRRSPMTRHSSAPRRLRVLTDPLTLCSCAGCGVRRADRAAPAASCASEHALGLANRRAASLGSMDVQPTGVEPASVHLHPSCHASR